MSNYSSLPPQQPGEPQPQPEFQERELNRLKWIFIGQDGLRAGWKCLLFVGVVIVITIIFHPLQRRLPQMDPRAFGARAVVAHEALRLLITILATILMIRLIDRKPWDHYGLPLRPAFRTQFWTGAIIGFGALALQLAIMHLGGWFDFGPKQLHGIEIFKMGAWWGLAFVLVGLFEEFQLRGYFLRVLADGMKFWPAAVLTSAIFAALHIPNPGETVFGIIMVFLDGLLMCFALYRTGNLWFPIGQHAAWDWAQTFFFGVPNSGTVPAGALRTPIFRGPELLSGGTTGPEGSVLVLFSLALTAVLVAVIYRRPRPEASSEPQHSGVIQIES